MKFHCLFEQSGTFKNELKKLGYEAIDYDILNDFGETDKQINLFEDIEAAYIGHNSIFDEIGEEDVILAFFPCTRFEQQITMHFRGEACKVINWSDEKKLEYNLRLHKELTKLYELVTKLVIICIKRNLKLILENPYSSQHYLTRYWPIKPKVVDMDRTERGDFYKKPTQYFFINCEPKYNMIFEPINYKDKRIVEMVNNKVERSLISSDYANRFLKEFVLEKNE